MTLRGRFQNYLTRILLWVLNNQWLNPTPCRYGYINGLEAVSYQELRNEIKQNPNITVQELVNGIDRFNSCPVRRDGGFTVIEPDGSMREGNVWDVHELRQALTPPNNV